MAKRDVRREHITKSLVDALKPAGKEYTVYDDEVRPWGIRVRPSGAKVYLLRLHLDGRQRFYTIGPHGQPWTPETGRAEALRVLGQAANVRKLRETGVAPPNLLHPVEAREEGKTRPTLAEFAVRYLRDYAIPHKKPGTVEADRGLLGLRERKKGEDERPEVRTILGTLGTLRVDRVTRREIVAFHLGWRDTPYRANRGLALLSHMFTMAEKWGLRADATNPCRHVERYLEMNRERYLSGVELGRVGQALAMADGGGKLTPFGLAAIRLLIFTGARASQILGLTWDRVDLRGRTIRVPPKGRGRTNLSTIHLNAPALQVLSKLPRRAKNVHVIVGNLAGKPLTLSGLEQVWQEVRSAAGLGDVRLHDLRHSFASVAVAGGASLPIIGGLLGHTHPATTARYAHLSADPLKAAVGLVGEAIAAAMNRKRHRHANVATIRRSRK